MKISIMIPTVTDIFNSSIDVAVANHGTTLSQLDLGDKGGDIGVYVIHHNRKIKYIGKTNGKSMTFGIRLRRHFQEKAAGKHTFPRLKGLHTPPSIKVTLFTLKEIQNFITTDIKNVVPNDFIPIFEAALIAALKPEFQQ